MSKKATIIAVVNQKGGTGKTTTTENLGVGLALEGKKVLLVDTDPQASLTVSLGNPCPDELSPTLSDLMGKIMVESPIGASGDTELFEKASNINGFQGGRVANNLYISPFRATVFKTAALFLYLNSSVVIRVRKPLFFPL